jgi:putative Mg2+ transporter-C (MgtC) family protein
MLTEQEAILRMALAIGLGAALGFERERLAKPAGIRTYALVCLGSAMFMIGSILLGDEVRKEGGSGYDPSRIGSTIVQGIGFLAAGVIFTSRGRVRGLTTAAGIWVTAAIGLLVGSGFYLIAIVGGAMTVATLVILGWLEDTADFGGDIEAEERQSHHDGTSSTEG